MEYKLLQEKYKRCCQLVTNQRLSEAFIVLHELISESHNGDLTVMLENHRETYNNILRYSFGEVEDPEKKTVYYHLLQSVLELADEARENIIFSQHLLSYWSVKRETIEKLSLLPEEVKSFIDELINNLESETGTSASDPAILEQHRKINRLFELLWLTDKYRDTEREFALSVINSDKLPWWVQCLAISAITLSLQRYFDETKLDLLAHAYKRGASQIWQRALIGVLITLYQYQTRLYLYPRIKEMLDALHENSVIEKQVESVVIQFIKAKDTEKIAQKFQEEILPEIVRMQSRIHDKLDVKNMIQDPFSDEKNPDWEHVFEDTPDLLNKLEELSMLQAEGSDVFMSAFSMLKQFDFFNEIKNWFIPFYKENTEILSFLKIEGSEGFNMNEFADSLEQSSILCNSDKYSFCLNINRIPQENQTMMLDLFKMEIKAMEEMDQDDEILQKPTRARVIYTQYIQDIYRFSKLYSNKDEFYDIFSTSIDFHNLDFFSWLIKDQSIVRNIGEFFFEKEFYQDAIEVFSKIDTLPGNYELWQKIAYCYQKMGNYQKALEFYLRADLADIRKVWNIKKIALCYRRLGNYSKALEYYLEAEKLEPENLHVQANLAHTYLDLKDYENALKVYFKVEFLAPDNIKIQRPVAWCSFMLGKFDTARKYFEKVLSSDESRHDLLNLGHIEWCMGNKQKAIERYKQCLGKAEFNFEWFANELRADSEILVRYGIDPIDIPLMRDYLKVTIEHER